MYGVFSLPPPLLPVSVIMAKRGLKPCGGRRIDVMWTMRRRRGKLVAGAGKRKKLHRPLRNHICVAWGRVWVSEMRPGQTRSYKELFPDRLGGEEIHIKGMGGGRRVQSSKTGKGSSKILGPEITAPCLPAAAHRPSTCQPPAFVAPLCHYSTNHPCTHPQHQHHHYYHDLPKIQFGFYPSKKLYNGSDAWGQNPIPGKVNNLKLIIICRMYDTIQYIYNCK